MFAGEHVNVTNSRFQLSRYLTLALEFQLSSDVLGTALSPTWTAIGKLAAIGTIRTALNYVLTREMREEWPRAAAPESEAVRPPGRPGPTNLDG